MSAGPNPKGNSNTPQPATARMLRSVSGSMKSSAEHMVSTHQKSQNQAKLAAGLPPMGSHNMSQLDPKKELMQPFETEPRDPQSQQPHQQQFYRRSIGDWDFVRTIGAGSMGKVKLAKHNATGEKCAVKIVPRAAKLYQRAHANDPPLRSQEEASQRQKEFEKEVARDKRTIREGALGRLLFHPHICRLYEMVPMTNHYYMLFEYVEGGQLLDYIVSHGSLNEKYARKFSRGIASALDYCHKNNVVHRDLKIENIMISKDGEIKIIDFGLSNLYTPHNLLKTYCGSLYFAAPELLCAKPYTGPEVDVWSFGVVLYVLVCGKVPFDDPVVSALHEKIKKGNVEYPSFISRECVSLLSRMLVVDPTKRATLSEVIHHPWMNKGFEYLVPSYTPKRIPLTLPLDPQIIHTIASFDLGSVSSILEDLTLIITSPEYLSSSEQWYMNAKNGRPPSSHGPNPVYGFHPLISIYYLVDEMRKRKKAKEEAMKSHMRQQYSESSINQPVQHVPSSHTQNMLRSPPLKSDRPSTSDGFTGRPPSRQPSLNRTEPVSNPFKPGYSSASMSQPRSPPPPPQQKPPTLQIPEQAHTALDYLSVENKLPSGARREDTANHPFQQQSRSTPLNLPETLDPNAPKPVSFNSLLRKMSGKKYRSPSPTNDTPPIRNEQVVSPRAAFRPAGHLSPSKAQLRQSEPYNQGADSFVRRGVSMKVTAKEKSGSIGDSKSEKYPRKDRVKTETATYRSHNRSHSTSNRDHGYVPMEYLPPLPNINAGQIRSGAMPDINQVAENKNTHLQEKTSFHPTARAKSLGSHGRKDSSSYRGGKNQPALPDAMATQNSDDGIDDRDDHENGVFDDVLLDEKSLVHIPQMSEAQIIEQFHNAKRNSMPSIEYPKTLFLKGFFSVQTTSTKPLPVIRYNILSVLSKLRVKFQEVKGGFLCVHTSLIVSKDITSNEQASIDVSTIIDEYRSDLNSEERRLYGNAFGSSSGSFRKSRENAGIMKTPESDAATMHIPQIVTPQSPSVKQLSRKGSLQGSGSSGTTSSNSHVKGHKSSNSIGHRRKFSMGQTFLQNYRKKNGSQSLMPPNTPAAAKINRLLSKNGEIDDGDLDEEMLAHMRKLSYDDSMDSINGDINEGGSDMLISSRIEQRARHQRSNSVFSQEEAQKRSVRKTPLKFEINIVKVPLVGLYGVQFKKTLGNTWSYKTLASQILEELNL